MILDASVLLSAFFPDETQEQAQFVLREHEAGRVLLKAPMLLIYEVTNAVWEAERRGRISSAQTNEILRATAGLDIELFPLEWGESLPLARRFGRSAYDTAYLTTSAKPSSPAICAFIMPSTRHWAGWFGLDIIPRKGAERSARITPDRPPSRRPSPR